ncbi:MAG: ATP-grasp domain-containing protein [Promethearchaeota archaeon]
MDDKSKNVLVIGFNTRPLAYSLNQAGYNVYAVDFFGDLDLYPIVKDCLIVIKELGSDYNSAKGIYSHYLAEFTIDLLKKYPNLDYLIIGSGLDDGIKERSLILDEITKNEHQIVNVNNKLDTIIKSRDIELIYKLLKNNNYYVPITISLAKFLNGTSLLVFPVILKKRNSSGGLNIFKIDNEEKLEFIIKKLEIQDSNYKDWVIQEYIQGIPVSCSTISNGNETEIISINRQIIGEKFLYSPKEFMYCGNVVPANIFKKDEKLISEISIYLANELNLMGINGFDYVLRNHYPYLMEINPRIPGSIRASESALNLNLLDLHLKSFDLNSWETIKQVLRTSKFKYFSTKLILFSPKRLKNKIIKQINEIENVHDKNDPEIPILVGAPICTVLFEAETFNESYFGALKIIDKIKQIIN